MKTLKTLLILICILFACCESEKPSPIDLTSDLKLEVNEIALDEGESKKIVIVSGNGGYSVHVQNPDIATVVVEQNDIIVYAHKEGLTIFTIKDKEDKSAIVSVEVIAHYETVLLPKKIQISYEREGNSDITTYITEEYIYDEYARISEINNNSVFTMSPYVEQMKLFYDNDILTRISSDYNWGFHYIEEKIFAYKDNVIEMDNQYQKTMFYIYTDKDGYITKRQIDRSDRTLLYEYDNKKNVIKYRTKDGYIDYYFKYDDKNGIFKNVNCSQWAFMECFERTPYILGDGGLTYWFCYNNNFIYIKNSEGSHSLEYSCNIIYNEDNYPVKIIQNRLPNNVYNYNFILDIEYISFRKKIRPKLQD